MTETRTLPQSGGTYSIGKDGKMKRDGGTAGPLDPSHEANRPAAPAQVRKEADK